MLLDPVWAYAASIPHLDASCGLLLTSEDHAFREVDGGRLSAEIEDWTVAKARRIGADGVKFLAWYRPDAAPGVCLHQQDLVERVGQACAEHDLAFLLELLVCPLPGEDAQTTDYVEHAAKRPERVLASLAIFTDPKYGVDVFKLESPVAAGDLADPDGDGAAECRRWFDEIGRVATRPWVMLSAGADMETFSNVLRYAYAAGASGPGDLEAGDRALSRPRRDAGVVAAGCVTLHAVAQRPDRRARDTMVVAPGACGRAFGAGSCEPRVSPALQRRSRLIPSPPWPHTAE